MTNEMQESAQIQMRRTATAEVRQTLPLGGNEGERERNLVHSVFDYLNGTPRFHNLFKYLINQSVFLVKVKGRNPDKAQDWRMIYSVGK